MPRQPPCGRLRVGRLLAQVVALVEGVPKAAGGAAGHVGEPVFGGQLEHGLEPSAVPSYLRVGGQGGDGAAAELRRLGLGALLRGAVQAHRPGGQHHQPVAGRGRQRRGLLHGEQMGAEPPCSMRSRCAGSRERGDPHLPLVAAPRVGHQQVKAALPGRHPLEQGTDLGVVPVVDPDRDPGPHSAADLLGGVQDGAGDPVGLGPPRAVRPVTYTIALSSPSIRAIPVRRPGWRRSPPPPSPAGAACRSFQTSLEVRR